MNYWIKADKKFLWGLITGKKKYDFDWNAYHLRYEKELEDLEKQYTLSLDENFSYKNNQISCKNNMEKPFIPHHKLLLETILQLSPSSVLEIGCGWGDHLHNLHILSPKINLHGIDISEEQIRNLKKRHPKLIAKLSVIDITQPNCEIPKCDLVYSNAVLLHIKDELKFISALTNFFKASNDVVILKENWESHNFFEDIKKLFEEKSIPWKKIFFYYAELNEKSNIKIMIASKSKLNFPDLTDYKLLQN